jgi:protein-disulfide isomerase
MTRATPAVPPTAPVTRHDRRRLELDQRREQRRQAREKPASSPLRSPMVLFTAAALIVGLVIVGFMLLTRPAAPSVADLIPPGSEIPAGAVADGRTLGSPSAKVTVEIWSDFQCPACMDFATLIEPPTISTYVVQGKVRLVYHDAAFQGAKVNRTYDESVEAAAAARCAADQGMFWQMHNWLFANWNGENEYAFTADRLRAMATAAGLDLTTYDTCMATGDQQAAVRSETASTATAGITQTPTLIVNGVSYVGSPNSFSAFALVLDQAYAAAP